MSRGGGGAIRLWAAVICHAPALPIIKGNGILRCLKRMLPMAPDPWKLIWMVVKWSQESGIITRTDCIMVPISPSSNMGVFFENYLRTHSCLVHIMALCRKSLPWPLDRVVAYPAVAKSRRCSLSEFSSAGHAHAINALISLPTNEESVCFDFVDLVSMWLALLALIFYHLKNYSRRAGQCGKLQSV